MTTETRVSQMPATPTIVDQRLKALEIAVTITQDKSDGAIDIAFTKGLAEEILAWARRPM